MSHPALGEVHIVTLLSWSALKLNLTVILQGWDSCHWHITFFDHFRRQSCLNRAWFQLTSDRRGVSFLHNFWDKLFLVARSWTVGPAQFLHWVSEGNDGV